MVAGIRTQKAKSKLRALRRKAVRVRASLFRSYGPDDLRAAIVRLGVVAGDTVMLHSAFDPKFGFQGSSADVVDTFIDVLGPDGHLLMVSLPYRTSSLDYLKDLRVFDVRRTPSAMGLISEFFRRRPDVLRSLHPTHPVLVRGPRADWFVAGHEDCVHPCGDRSPFARLAEAGGKVVFYNVSVEYLTFFHYLEHLVSPQLPFPLYTQEVFEVPVLDAGGRARTVHTHAFSREAIRRRRFERLEEWLEERGLVSEVRVGGSRILACDTRQIVTLVEEKARAGVYFYDLDGTQQQ
jgi:aminoglycoside 3-N-acetyltransferase